MSGMGLIRQYIETVTDDCISWPMSHDTKGYPQVCTGHQKIEKANRVVCRMVHGEPPTPEHQAAHSCGNRSCVNWDHISWKTQSENEADKKVHGTLVKNTWGKRGKLTARERQEIKQDRKTPKVILAKKYGVRRGAIEYHQNKD